MRHFPESLSISGLLRQLGHPAEALLPRQRVTDRPQAADTQDLQTLIVIVGESDATFCSNSNGITQFIRVMRCGCAHEAGADKPCEYLIGDDRASRRRFARELIVAVQQDTNERQYDDVIVLADQSMIEDLGKVRINRPPNLLIAPLPKADDPIVAIQ